MMAYKSKSLQFSNWRQETQRVRTIKCVIQTSPSLAGT